MSFQDQVHEFHAKCGFHIGRFGGVPPLEVRRSRAALVWEEACELITELLSDDTEYVRENYPAPVGKGWDEQGNLINRPVDPAKVAHEGIDLTYVATGAFVNFGVDQGSAFVAVHGANMRKAYLADREVGDENGKARKPADWQPVDVSTVLRPYTVNDNAEQAARWLADRSRHPRYEGEGWRLLLDSEVNVDHASRQAAAKLPAGGGTTQEVLDAVEVLRARIRGAG